MADNEKGADEVTESRTPAKAERTYSIQRLIRDAPQAFGIPTHAAAGAFQPAVEKGTSELTAKQARALIDTWQGGK